MSIQHAYTQTVADGTATSVVRPSDWNSNHVVQYQLGGNTAGSASISGQEVFLYGGNNVTLSADTLNSRLYISAPHTTQFLTTAQPPGAYLTTARASNDAIGLNTALTANGVAWTVNSSGLSLNVPAFITTAALSNHGHAFSASGGSSSFQTLNFANSNGVTFSNTNGSVRMAHELQYSSNTSNITAAAFPSADTTKFAGTNSTFAGTNVSGSMTVNSNGVNLALSAAGAGVINQTGPNIAVAGSTVTAGDVMFSNANGVTFGMNGSTITASAAGGGGGEVDRYYKEIIFGERFTTVAGFSNTAYTNRPLLMPFHMNGTGLTAKTVRFMMSFGASSNRSLGGTFHCGIYSLANATQMTLLGSDSWSISSTASASSASWNGIAWVDFTGMSNLTMTAEGRYAMAIMVNPVSANQTWMPCTLYGADNMPNNQSRIWSNNATSSLNATYQFVPFWGVYTATTSALPGSIGSNQLNNASSVKQIMYYANIKEI